MITPKSSSDQVKLDLVILTSEGERHRSRIGSCEPPTPPDFPDILQNPSSELRLPPRRSIPTSPKFRRTSRSRLADAVPRHEVVLDQTKAAP
jgi:hypothetical protein